MTRRGSNELHIQQSKYRVVNSVWKYWFCHDNAIMQKEENRRRIHIHYSRFKWTALQQSKYRVVNSVLMPLCRRRKKDSEYTFMIQGSNELHIQQSKYRVVNSVCKYWFCHDNAIMQKEENGHRIHIHDSSYGGIIGFQTFNEVSESWIGTANTCIRIQ